MFGETLVERLLDDKARLEKPLRLWMPMWQEISEVIIPRRSDITVRIQEGGQRERRLFDSTAVSANERLAGSIVGTVMPSTFQWFDPVVPELYTVSVPAAVDNYAAAVGKDMYRTIQVSNFNVAVQEMAQDLVAFGTSAMFLNDIGNGLFKARTMHPGEYAIDTNSDNEIIKVIRFVKMTVREIITTWGIEAVAPRTREILESKDSDTNKIKILSQEVEVMHWISYRNNEPFGFPVDTFPIASIYVDVTNKYLIKKSGFHEWPCPVVRWSSTSGERYGRGPGFTALPDVLSLNRAEELSLRAWAKAIEPPILALHDGILGQPDFRPSRISYMNMEGAIQYLEPKMRLDIETVKREDKRRSIWNIYFMDQVQFIPERGKTPPSAEEIRSRLNIMLQIVGPQLVRLEKEFLVPTLSRVFGIR
ncbi:MAG TPA: portal protein, partial [Nitrososphaera sp.]|nr:portal protein [Nitrososphaera sp.]